MAARHVFLMFFTPPPTTAQPMALRRALAFYRSTNQQRERHYSKWRQTLCKMPRVVCIAKFAMEWRVQVMQYSVQLYQVEYGIFDNYK